MQRSESPFSYIPGTSHLHKWSSVEGPLWWVGVSTKAIVFIIVEFALARVGYWQGPLTGLLTYVLVFVLGIGFFVLLVGSYRAQLLLRDCGVVGGLGLSVGLPIYWLATLLVYRMGYGPRQTFIGSAWIIVTLVAAICAMLAVAALFMATTSFAASLRQMRGSPGLRAFLAIAFTYFPRFEEDILAGGLALQSLCRGARISWAERSRRFVLLICALLWRIIAVTSRQVYLAMVERSGSSGGARK